VRKIVRITFGIEHLHDARIDDHLHAYGTGEMGGVDVCPIDGNTMICCLNNGILLSVKPPAELMTFS
jgi:hypothetical protein